MKLQFIDKVFEKSTPIFLAGVLLLLLPDYAMRIKKRMNERRMK